MLRLCRVNINVPIALQRGAQWPSLGLATGWSWVRILLRQLPFGTLANPVTPLCQCLSEETLKAVGHFYLVSMPGEVKDPTQGGKCVTCHGLHHS